MNGTFVFPSLPPDPEPAASVAGAGVVDCQRHAVTGEAAANRWTTDAKDKERGLFTRQTASDMFVDCLTSSQPFTRRERLIGAVLSSKNDFLPEPVLILFRALEVNVHSH